MRLVLHYLGWIVLLSSVFRIIPIITGLVYGEPIMIFLVSIGVSFLIGGSLLVLGKQGRKFEYLTTNEAFILIGLSFIVVALISSLSFLSTTGNFVDALFESVSGVTTTGLSTYSSVESLPRSLLMWRAVMQWVGGLGIVLFLIFILFNRDTRRKSIEHMQETGHIKTALTVAQGVDEAMKKGMKITAGIKIYGVYTLMGIVALLIAGMPFYDATAMTFASVSTGGFGVHDQLQLTLPQMVIIILLMLAGATSFVAHNKLFKLQLKEFILQRERNILFLLMIIAGGIAFFSFPHIVTVIFEIVSAYTTTGFSSTAIALLPELFIMMIMIGMIVGASTVSTGGGIKIFRGIVVAKSPLWNIKKIISPLGAVIPFKLNKDHIPEKTVMSIQIFVLLWIMLLGFGTIILMLLGNSFLDSSFQMTSALGTVGLSTMDVGSLHWIGKVVLMLGMLLGRVELYPIILLVRTMFRKGEQYT